MEYGQRLFEAITVSVIRDKAPRRLHGVWFDQLMAIRALPEAKR